jgi:hypothetical protein
LTGLVPVIRAFFAFDGTLGEDVGGWNKSGHGVAKVVQVSAAKGSTGQLCADRF